MTQNKTYRMIQVNRLLQEEIANILLSGLQDERMKQVTVTEVRTTKDLRHATVLITIYDDQNREDVLEFINSAAGYIRKTMGSKISLKRTPELEFRYDDSLDNAVRIMHVLDEVKDDLVDKETEEE